MTQVDYSSAQACCLFALMNSAPAELLHPLTYAALQPSLAAPADFRHWIQPKHVGNFADIGIDVVVSKPVSQKKRRLARQGRVWRRDQFRSNRSSTIH
jgi:hypothetical protein